MSYGANENMNVAARGDEMNISDTQYAQTIQHNETSMILDKSIENMNLSSYVQMGPPGQMED